MLASSISLQHSQPVQRLEARWPRAHRAPRAEYSELEPWTGDGFPAGLRCDVSCRTASDRLGPDVRNRNSRMTERCATQCTTPAFHALGSDRALAGRRCDAKAWDV